MHPIALFYILHFSSYCITTQNWLITNCNFMFKPLTMEPAGTIATLQTWLQFFATLHHHLSTQWMRIAVASRGGGTSRHNCTIPHSMSGYNTHPPATTCYNAHPPAPGSLTFSNRVKVVGRRNQWQLVMFGRHCTMFEPKPIFVCCTAQSRKILAHHHHHQH